MLTIKRRKRKGDYLLRQLIHKLWMTIQYQARQSRKKNNG